MLDGFIPELDDVSYVPPPPPPPPPPPAANASSFWGDTGESLDTKIKFKPSLLNTVVFLVQTAQQVSVMAVNYKGRCSIFFSSVFFRLFVALSLRLSCVSLWLWVLSVVSLSVSLSTKARLFF